jgi:hypothetical protein
MFLKGMEGVERHLELVGVADDKPENRTEDTEGKLANTGRQYWKTARLFFRADKPISRASGKPEL